MLKLSKIQEKLVKQKKIGNGVIKGESRSGKTAVALNRMLYLTEHACRKNEHVLFLCLNDDKKKRIETCLKQYKAEENMSLFDAEPKGEAIIKSVDEMIREAADKAHVHLNLEMIEQIPEELLLNQIKQVKLKFPKVKWLNEDHLTFIEHEILWINSCGFLNLDDYQKAARKGAVIKLPKKGSGRKALWQIREFVGEDLKLQGKMLRVQMELETLKFIREDILRHTYKHIIIDDAEALSKVQLEFIKCLKSEGLGEVLFVMNKNESSNPFAWLSKGQNFKSIGYDMTGRVKHLISKKQSKAGNKERAIELTPLEIYINSCQPHRVEETKKGQEEVQPVQITFDDLTRSISKTSSLPWYVETYRYINKITGVETVFQGDSSAGEVYVDEVRQEEVEQIPIYSDIAAGMPIEIVDGERGRFSIPSELLHHKKNVYMLHVQGDSMTGVDILNGDYVMIQAGSVNPNEIAAVYYNGATTLKRIVQDEGQILLCSENPKYPPIVIEEGDFRVMGKLIGVIKAC